MIMHIHCNCCRLIDDMTQTHYVLYSFVAFVFTLSKINPFTAANGSVAISFSRKIPRAVECLLQLVCFGCIDKNVMQIKIVCLCFVLHTRTSIHT